MKKQAHLKLNTLAAAQVAVDIAVITGKHHKGKAYKDMTQEQILKSVASELIELAVEVRSKDKRLIVSELADVYIGLMHFRATAATSKELAQAILTKLLARGTFPAKARALLKHIKKGIDQCYG